MLQIVLVWDTKRMRICLELIKEYPSHSLEQLNRNQANIEKTLQQEGKAKMC